MSVVVIPLQLIKIDLIFSINICAQTSEVDYIGFRIIRQTPVMREFRRNENFRLACVWRALHDGIYLT